jgi:hypothetical protein
MMDLASLSEQIKKATDDFEREATEARRIVVEQEQAALIICSRLFQCRGVVRRPCRVQAGACAAK